MSWDPQGTGPIAPKREAARAAVTTLAQELDRLGVELERAVDAVDNALVDERVAAQRRADQRATIRRQVHRERCERSAAEIAALPAPPGRAGVLPLGSPAAVAPSGTAPALLRIGAARFPRPCPDAPAHVAGTVNLEIRPTATQDRSSIDVLWTVVLRRLLDVSPTMHRIVVLDATTVSGPLLDLARLPYVSGARLVTFANTEAEMVSVLDDLTAATKHAYVDVLQQSGRTIVQHNAAVAPHERLPFTTVVLPNGYEHLPGHVARSVALLARDGPAAGTSVVVRVPPGRTVDPLHDAVTVRLETQRSSLAHRGVRYVEDLQLDPPVTDDALEKAIAAVETAVALTPRSEPATHADAWTSYTGLVRSLQVDVDRHAKDEAAADAALVKEMGTLEATRDDRQFLVGSLQRRTRTVRTATRNLAQQLRVLPPPANAATTGPPTDIEQYLATLTADVERVEELLMRANAAKLEADAEAAEAADREAWARADAARQHDIGLGVSVFLGGFFVTAFAWIVLAHSPVSVLGCIVLTGLLGAVVYALLHLHDATRGLLSISGVWSTAHHPDDRDGTTPTAAEELRTAIAGASAGVGAVAGAAGRLVLSGHVLLAIAVASVFGLAITVALWNASDTHVRDLQLRSKRFTALRPHRHGADARPAPPPPPPRG